MQQVAGIIPVAGKKRSCSNTHQPTDLFFLAQARAFLTKNPTGCIYQINKNMMQLDTVWEDNKALNWKNMSMNPPPEGPLTERALFDERHRTLFRSIQNVSLRLPVSLLGQIQCPICDKLVKVFPAFNEYTSKGWANLQKHMVKQHPATMAREEIKQKYGIDLPATPQQGNEAAKQAAKTDTALSRKLKANAHHKIRDHRIKQWMRGKAAALAFEGKTDAGKWLVVEQHSNKFSNAWEEKHDLIPGSFANYDKAVAIVKQLEDIGYRGLVLSYPALFPKRNNGSANPRGMASFAVPLCAVCCAELCCDVLRAVCRDVLCCVLC